MSLSLSRFRCLRDYCVGLCRLPHTIVENFLLLSQNSRIRQIFPVERVQKTRNRVSKSAFKGMSAGIAVLMSGYRPVRPLGFTTTNGIYQPVSGRSPENMVERPLARSRYSRIRPKAAVAFCGKLPLNATVQQLRNDWVCRSAATACYEPSSVMQKAVNDPKSCLS